MPTVEHTGLTLANLVTIISVVILGVIALIGMVNDKYKDTFWQCVGLSIVAGLSVVMLLQFLFRGEPTELAYAWMLAGVAVYALGTVGKHMGYERKSKTMKRRRDDTLSRPSP